MSVLPEKIKFDWNGVMMEQPLINSKLPAIVAACLLLPLLSEVHGFSDTFSDTNFTGGLDPLSGQQGWSTNDPFKSGTTPPTTESGETSFIEFITGWSVGGSGGGDQSAMFGGVFKGDDFHPGVEVPNLSKSFTPFATGPTSFTLDFGMIDPLAGSGTQDIFGFTLTDGTQELLTIEFDPSAATVTDIRVQWYDNGVLQTTSNPAVIQNREFSYGSKHRLLIEMNGSTFDAYISDLAATTNIETNIEQFVDDGSISNSLTANDFSEVEIFWELTDITVTNERYEDAGENYMIIDAVSAVPEPGSALLLIAGGFALLMTRRRNR